MNYHEMMLIQPYSYLEQNIQFVVIFAFEIDGEVEIDFTTYFSIDFVQAMRFAMLNVKMEIFIVVMNAWQSVGCHSNYSANPSIRLHYLDQNLEEAYDC